MINEQTKVKIIMVKGEKGDPGDVGDYGGLTNKPRINGVVVSGDKTAANYGLVGETQLAMVQRAADARIDTLEAGQTNAASGYIVEQQTANVQAESLTESAWWIHHTFTIPANAHILSAFYAVTPQGGYSITWKTLDLTVDVNSATGEVDVSVIGDSSLDDNEWTFMITYAYVQTVSLSELTDVRVGYDGTLYASAGTAVRQQVSELWERHADSVAYANNDLGDYTNVADALDEIVRRIVALEG